MTTAVPMPALFLSHGAPPLLDSELWVRQLGQLSADLPRPSAILIVSAHWEAAPLTIGATDARVPLTYDFWGFPDRFYEITYAPAAADLSEVNARSAALAQQVAALMPDSQAIHHDSQRRLDHGAFIPLTVMYPDADIPVVQISLPTLDPHTLLTLGERLAALRDEGVLIIGSGFTTHGLPYLRDPSPDAAPPGWSREFDHWAQEAFSRGDVETLVNFRSLAPGMPYAHPTIEHFAPLFVALGASGRPEQIGDQVIDGFWMGLAKRSLQLA